MDVKLLTAHHVTLWKQLRLSALQEAPASFGSSYEEELDYSDADWENSLERSDVFGAFVGDVLAGVAGFFSLKKTKTKHRGVLFSLFTLPEYRGQGIASALIKAVISHAQSRVLQIHLSCVTSNQTAIRLYEKIGFRIYGTEPRALKIGDQYLDEHLMIMELG